MDHKATDFTEQFKNGELSLNEYRVKLRESIAERGLELQGIVRNKNFNAEDPEEVAKTVELATYFQTMYKAQKGSPEANYQLKQWHTKANMVEGTDASGGYLVPTEFHTMLMKFVEGASEMIPYLTKIRMNRDSMKVPILDDRISVSWHQEGDDIDQTDATFSEATLNTRRLDCYTICSNELLEDSATDIAGLLIEQFAEEAGQAIDNAILNGDGSDTYGGFSGIFTPTISYSTVFGSGSTAFSSISVEHLIDLYHDVPTYARENGLFVMHPDVAVNLQKETDAAGNYLWNPYGQNRTSIHGKYPIVECNQAPSTSGADTAFVGFGNFRWILYGARKNAGMLMDPYTLAAKYQTRIVIVQRLALEYAKRSAFSRLMTAAS